MKTFYSILSVAILVGTTIAPAKAAVEVSVDFFHDNLDSYGDWREVGDYGYCWQPRDVSRNWRPYSDGHWLYTDAGWTWNSEEPYSWAVYHYGRWARVDRIGWVWVPGTEWGPAWVSWRRSPRHVGWAPLPPEALFSHSVGFSARVDADYDIGPTNYSFVEVRNFGAPRLREFIVEPRQNLTIINQTTNITRVTYVNNVVYNEGPQYDVISRETAQPIRRLKLERREELDGDPRTMRAEQLRAKVEGDSLRVVAPQFDAKPATTAPRKVAAKVENAEVNHGWKNAGPPADVAKLRSKIKSEPATSPELAPQSKTEKTAASPDVSPAPSSAREEKPTKGKVRNGRPQTIPAAPVTTGVAPASPEKPVVPPKHGKQAGKPETLKPEAGKLRSSPPSVERVVPSAQSKKDRSNETAPLRPAAKALPEEHVQERKPKAENVVPTHPLPPAAVEPARRKIQPGKVDARPKPEQPVARSVERNVPNVPKPRPQAKAPQPRQQTAPAVKQPQPSQPAKANGKDKGKDEKKDGAKPDGTLQ